MILYNHPMKILLIYGTYSTGTLTVSQLIQSQLQEKGHEVTIMRNDQVQGADMMAHEMIIMGSPSWKVFNKQGMPHEWYYPMMERLKGQVFDKPFAVFALGDESYALVFGSADHLQGFVKDLGGHEVIEPLKIEGFYFAKQQRTEEIKAWVDQLHQKLQG